MRWVKWVRNFLAVDTPDLIVMVGGGFFFSSLTSVVWKLLESSPLPQRWGFVATITGVVIGRLVTLQQQKARTLERNSETPEKVK